MLYALALLASPAMGASEVMMPLPGGGQVALSTRGPSAFRVRFTSGDPIDTPMVLPDAPDAAFTKTADGISAAFGAVSVSSSGVLSLLDASGKTISQTLPLGGSADICTSREADVSSATRVASPQSVADQGACCDACKQNSDCTNWIYGHPGNDEGNCWLVKEIDGIHSASSRTLGGANLGSVVSFSTSNGQLYGRGAGGGDGTQLTANSVSPHVENRESYAPHYWSTDGYAALGVVNITTGNGKTNYFPADYSSDGQHITWSYGNAPAFELYLMPAATIDDGTAAYYALIGAPLIPPRYAFGFTASRWGWEDATYIEVVLQKFRDDKYPIDAMIADFEWFTNVSDYDFQPPGESWYDDFGWQKVCFPDPIIQLQHYHNKLHIKMGGIRKPRIGNTDLLNFCRSKGWILPGGELLAAAADTKVEAPDMYSIDRNLDYSIPDARAWYVDKQAHYITDGVDFFWNDEGETNFFTFYWWNVAQLATLRQAEPNKRFYSLNRAFSPGLARLGAATWTGDVNPTWEDLSATPGMVLNWGLAGAPYVGCDIGGFTGQTQGDLLTRWYQVGTYMPIMRVHSTKDATPHFPWLWGDYAPVMRQALNLRYQLIPYHYSLAHAMYASNRLWMRPMVAEYPDDDKAVPLSSQWFDGDLMVAPVLRQDSQKDIYLPAGTWYAFNGNASTVFTGPTSIQGNADINEVPVFVRPGSIVPLAPLVQYADALPGGPLQVQVYAGQDGTFDFIEDDGGSTAYESGKVRTTSFAWKDSSKTLSWTVEDNSGGSVANGFEQLYLTLYTDSGVSSSATKMIGTSGSIAAN